MKENKKFIIWLLILLAISSSINIVMVGNYFDCKNEKDEIIFYYESSKISREKNIIIDCKDEGEPFVISTDNIPAYWWNLNVSDCKVFIN